MKKIFIYTAILATVATACSKLDNTPTQEGKDPNEVKMITEKVSGNVDPSSKATIADENAAFSWTEGDNVAVHVTNGVTSKFVFTSDPEAHGASTSGSSASFTVAYEEGYSRNAFAVYPSTIVDADSYNTGTNTLTVTLPSSYALATVTGETTPCPMIATNTGSSWTFKQLCGLLRLTIDHIPSGTASILLDFRGKKVCGDFSIAAPNPGSSTIATASSDTEDKITVTGITGLTSATINIPLPVGDYEKIAVSYLSSTSEQLAEAIKYLSSTTPTTLNPSPVYTAQRAHGKKVTIDNTKLAFRGYWIAPGTLKRDVDGSDVTYSITEGNPTEFLGYFGQSSSVNKYYFRSSTISAELSKLPAGWKLPSQSEWGAFVWSNPQTAIYFNGTSITGDPVNSQRGCFIFVHVVDTDVDIIGLVLLRDGAHIVCPEIVTSNVGKKNIENLSPINLSVLNYLISNYGCVFLPGTGNYMPGRTFTGPVSMPWAYLTDYYMPNESLERFFHFAVTSVITISIKESSQSLISNIYYPVRLIKAAN